MMAPSNGTTELTSDTVNVVRREYDWQRMFHEDPRKKALEAAFAQLITRIDPPQPLRMPPAQRYEAAPAPVAAPAVAPASVSHHEAPPMVKTEPVRVSNANSPDTINENEYMTSESSDMDTKEVDPIDELSDFESPSSNNNGVSAVGNVNAVPMDQETRPEPVQEPEDDDDAMADDMDIEMEDGQEDDGENEEPIHCAVCKGDDGEVILCDGCPKEFHLRCLVPPLQTVPDGEWFCPACIQAGRSTVQVKQEANRSNTTVPQTNHVPAPPPPAPAQVHVAQAFQDDAVRSNQLLVHACNCDEYECVDPEFHEFCPHMKRFLRSVCWATHNEKWRQLPIAHVTAQLFAYHSIHCTVTTHCNVPMCDALRAEEYV